MENVRNKLQFLFLPLLLAHKIFWTLFSGCFGVLTVPELDRVRTLPTASAGLAGHFAESLLFTQGCGIRVAIETGQPAGLAAGTPG